MAEESYKDADVLRELYWNQDKTLRELGDRFGVDTTTIHYWMDKHGIDRRFSGTLRERFEQYHEKGSADECWEWQNEPDKWGYGTIYDPDKPGYRKAHRVAFELYRDEELPEFSPKQQVNHTCHNPACVNPDHLYLGTQQQNMDDRQDAGTWEERTPKGEDVGTSKLTESEVAEIKRRLEKCDEYQYEIAEDYDVSHSMINKIAVGECWEHVKPAESD